MIRMSEEKGIMCYTSPKGYGKTYYELEKLRQDNQHLQDLQKNMDKQYEELEQENQQLNEMLNNILTSDGVTTTPVLDLVKENQRLKDKLKLVESINCFNMPNNIPMVCMFKADYERNKYEYETLDKYKSVLDEIREVLNNQMNYREFVDVVNAIEEILDKVKEGENND